VIAIQNIIHSGFISSIHKDDETLTDFISTTIENEIIAFIDKNDVSRSLNSLTIESSTTALYIQILPSEYVLYVPANSSRTINYCKIQQIKVLGELGQSIRYWGLFY
jgi:hypothetical protein